MSGPAPRRAGDGAGSGRVPYEYLVVRVVPRVERGEYLNAGVLLYCQARGWVGARLQLDRERLRALAPDADVAAIESALQGVGATAEGRVMADETPGHRFHWLAAPRSTVVQPGPVHAGLTEDPAAELDRLFARLVG